MMTEIVSVPNSLREQINQAQNLLAQSRQSQGYGTAEGGLSRASAELEILQTIAKQNPELGALFVAAKLGHKGIEWKSVEHTRRHELVELKFLGMSFGTQVVPVDEYRTQTRSVRFL